MEDGVISFGVTERKEVLEGLENVMTTGIIVEILISVYLLLFLLAVRERTSGQSESEIL